MIISLFSLPIKLNGVYIQVEPRIQVEVGTKKTTCFLQLISSSLWIMLGVVKEQWFMSLLSTNNTIQYIFLLHVIDQINTMSHVEMEHCGSAQKKKMFLDDFFS